MAGTPKPPSGRGFKFVPNPLITKQLQKDPQMGLMLRGRVEIAERIAKETAPVDTGDYREKIEGEVGLEPELGGWIGRLNGHDFKSHWIEFGTATGFQARAILRLACERAGLNVRRLK
jgi:hypothetical protein